MIHFGDHPPSHFHGRYGGHHARYALDGTRLDGRLPRRAENLIAEWASLHGGELGASWNRALRNEAPGTIEPLP